MTTLSFYGAAGEVTGSCYLVQTPRARVLVDFGLFQGDIDADRRNRSVPPIDIPRLDAVVLTHGHLDHCGRLPLLDTHGYTGAVYATPPTIGLSGIILRDAAMIQESDAEDANRRRAREGRPFIQPLYTRNEAERILNRFKGVPYDREREIASGVSIRFFDAGHILGSASIEMTIRADHESPERTIVFSGDIGMYGAPILRDPQPPPARADALIIESTYGDREHRSREATLDELCEILKSVKAAGGKVLVPAFSVGRTQDLIYHIAELTRAGRLPPLQVFIDSPMATAASELYADSPQVYDDQTRQILREGHSPLDFPGLRYIRTAQESRALNERFDGLVIIAGSGMCTGGRIVHHLRHSLARPDTHVIFVGYQAQGTLGRRLVDRARSVRIFGQEIPVAAQIHTLGGFSAHADRAALLRWIEPIGPSRPRTFITHGEDHPRDALQAALRDRYGFTAELPEWGDVATL